MTDDGTSAMASKIAIRLGLANLGIAVAFVLLSLSPLGMRPGAIHPVLVPFFLWTLMSWACSATGLGFAIYALVRRQPRTQVALGLFLNGAYLTAFSAFVWHMWPAWMGI